VIGLGAGVENLQKLGKPGDEIFNCITFTKVLAGDDVKILFN